MRTSASSRKKTSLALPIAVEFGREVCGDLSVAERREWLVTNGIGGFASGTVAGLLTRRYHALLVAAGNSTDGVPIDPTVLVSKVEETVRYQGSVFQLSTNRWCNGTVDPRGFVHIERFHLQGTIPVWTFSCADALLEKRIWMEDRENTTYVRYDLVRGSGSFAISIKALVNYRHYHCVTRADDWRMDVSAVDGGLSVTAFQGAQVFFMRSAAAGVQGAHDWYRDYDLAAERERGLEDREDALHAGSFDATVAPGKPLTLVFSTRPDAELDGAKALGRAIYRDNTTLFNWQRRSPSRKQDPQWLSQLVLASQQFIVDRTLTDGTRSHSIIAGYPWFTDWGRDAMIALPGLTLTTGRPDIARSILQTFAKFIHAGILPNYFPKAGAEPEYNSVDAALWYVEAMRAYYAATGDLALLRGCFPALAEIIERYHDGTLFNIHADPSDGLITAGEPGVQLTWMDAKVDDWIVTPRVGKPIEVNALWINALATVAELAGILGISNDPYRQWQTQAAVSFQRFWNEELQYCFDVLDGPGGNDDTLRPNQIFAVSLPQSALTPDQQRAVVDSCSRHLLTSVGLRTLAPSHSQYRPHCRGSRTERDAAYHQGTSWGWLLGPFALAHHRVYGDTAQALSFLEPLGKEILAYGVGTIGEIFDGEPPFISRGCIAQAWSVGELLRAWDALSQ